ncbi:MAG TPA: hypothetical protein VGV40_09680 [Solirubrobacteraceae bacterium]|nr:hypothetical protein [Solirubrobacteraceae bacterium]
MNALRSIARDLIDKRLWPVAALLTVGIVAALGLALTAGGGDDAPTAAATGAVPGRAGSAVTMAEESQLGDRGRLSGEGTDPFRRSAPQSPDSAVVPLPGGTPLPAGPADGLPDGLPDGMPSAGAPSPQEGGSTGSAGTAGAGRTAGSPEPPVRRRGPVYTFYEVDVRMALAGRRASLRGDVPRLTPLPSSRNPLVLFFGVFNEGASAGFLVKDGVRVRGSNCNDEPAGECSLLRLKRGRSARVSVEGRTYVLTVVAIRRVTTRDEATARRAFERRSRVGECLLNSDGGYGMLTFDPRSGTFQTGGDPEDCTKGKGAAAGGEWDLGRRWRSALGL